MDKKEQGYRMSLAHIEWISRSRKNELITLLTKSNQTLADYIERNLNNPSESLYQISHNENGGNEVWMPTEKEMQALISVADWYKRTATDLDEMGRIGINIVNFDESDYPQHLIKMLGTNVPTVIYYLGDKQILNKEAISMVGCRKACTKSLEWTDMIVKKFGTNAGKCVTSGYAKGIDQQSFRSAVQGGGKAIVILPQGIASFLDDNKELNKLIAEGKVLLISSYPIHSPWLREQALDRNKHIYAWGECTYVAESNDHGGTWSGANNALRKHWDVRVRIPQAEEGNASANLQLIKNGASGINNEGEIEQCGYLEEDNAKITDEMDKKLKNLLKNDTYSSKALIKLLGLDIDAKKLSTYIESIEGIVISGTKTKGYTLKKDLTLF